MNCEVPGLYLKHTSDMIGASYDSSPISFHST